jgi:hypothetical protein
VGVGRNQPCPCGSGEKYKRCHGRLPSGPVAPRAAFDLRDVLARHEAEERIRKEQQGLGRPIIAAKLNDQQIVAVKNTVYFSNQWKTFIDFLAHYVKQKLDPAWGNAEIAKPLNERHIFMQWYDALCAFQKKAIREPGKVTESAANGVLACYFSVAYALYLLEHNVELQDRLIHRLKDPGNFQGAYYELMVASALIRAGFELALEDETDPNSKHCEFSAVSRETGKKYWVEAKMRAVVGELGRTPADGTTSQNPISQLVRHLNGALAKPAADERLIFIDLNTPMAPDASEENRPDWIERAARRLEIYEAKELPPGTTAYVFVTNLDFHRELEGPARLIAFPFGLGMPDFNRPGERRISEQYLQNRKHADAIRVGVSLSRLLVLPATFDGSLPSETFHGATSRVVIGETYKFEGIGPRGDMIAKVTTATVVEPEKAAYLGVTSTDGVSQIIRQPMTDAELADYRTHPEAYFGRVISPGKMVKTPYELFEFFVDSYKSLSRGELLKRLKAGGHADVDGMTGDELLAIYCEAMTAGSAMFPQIEPIS